MKFETFLQELDKGKTVEQFCREHCFCMVECINNEVYDDQDLFDFLEELGAEITEYCDGYVIVNTDDGETFIIPSEDRENRFDETLPDETVLIFDMNSVIKYC